MCHVSSKITQKAESEKRDAATVRNERNCTRVRYGEKSGGNKKINTMYGFEIVLFSNTVGPVYNYDEQKRLFKPNKPTPIYVRYTV